VAIAALLAGCTGAETPLALVGGRDGLWRNVQKQCLRADRDVGNDCATVDKDRGYVLYKDMIGRSHYLVIPTTTMSGVEDPHAWSADAPNYWAFALAGRTQVSQRVGKPLSPQDVGLAINARQARSQDQLHIHVDCLSEDARRFLADHRTALGSGWANLAFQGKTVRATFVPSATAALPVNPFRVVLDAQGGDHSALADRGIFVAYTQAPGTPAGFVIVDEPVVAGTKTNGHASDFLDRGCAIGRDSARPVAMGNPATVGGR
jgi:CDP-diacylglycerol pyrophosphatase